MKRNGLNIDFRFFFSSHKIHKRNNFFFIYLLTEFLGFFFFIREFDILGVILGLMHHWELPYTLGCNSRTNAPFNLVFFL